MEELPEMNQTCERHQDQETHHYIYPETPFKAPPPWPSHYRPPGETCLASWISYAWPWALH